MTPEAFDPLNISPADFVLTTETETPADQPEPTKVIEPEVEATEPEVKTEESEDADGVETTDDELAELGFPALPPELAADEAIAKRYAETQYGIQKVLRQQMEVKQDLQKYADIAADLENPATAQKAFLALAEIQRNLTGIDPLEGLRGPSRAPEKASVEVPTEWDGFTPEQYTEAMELGCEYPSEYRMAKKLESRQEAKWKSIEDERAEARKQNEFNAFLDAEAPRVIGFLSKTENGWAPTKDMISTALKQFPNLKDDLPNAVIMAFPKEYAAHKVQAALKAQGQKGPELLTKGSSASKGVVLEPLDYDAPSTDLIHIIAANLENLSAAS